MKLERRKPGSYDSVSSQAHMRHLYRIDFKLLFSQNKCISSSSKVSKSSIKILHTKILNPFLFSGKFEHFYPYPKGGGLIRVGFFVCLTARPHTKEQSEYLML